MIHYAFCGQQRHPAALEKEYYPPVYMGKNVASNGNNTSYAANNSSLFITTLQKVRYSLLSE